MSCWFDDVISVDPTIDFVAGTKAKFRSLRELRSVQTSNCNQSTSLRGQDKKMKLITAGILATLCVTVFGLDNHPNNKVVCYWNSTSFDRPGQAKFQIDDLQPALADCTHLVYGWAAINPQSFEAISLHPHTDSGFGSEFFNIVGQLKRSFSDLKVYLSVGGNDDPYEETHKYLVVTETADARAKFVASINRIIGNYHFDGIDLAWQFPPIKVKKNRGTFSSIVHNIKKTFGYGKFEDKKVAEHRDGFTILVRDLKNLFRTTYNNNKDLTLTVLPHINASAYYDVRAIIPNLDAVHLFAFDQKSPDRNSKEADHTAPIYGSFGRSAQENVDENVRYWLDHGAPGTKIVVGIPTFGRTWRLTSDSQTSGVPPLEVDGPGEAGPQTATPGLLSYAEICPRLKASAIGQLTQVSDRSKKYGSYAYRSYNVKTGADGIWVSYEDPDTAGNKASYAKAKGLGGVAIVDLSLDDVRGVCTNERYPILKAAKLKL